MSDYGTSCQPAAGAQYIEDKRAKGHDVQVNSYALCDDPLELSQEIRQQILMAAIAGWKSRKPV